MKGDCAVNLSESETAKRLGLDKATLAHWRARNFGPPFRLLGKRIAYHSRELEEWLVAQMYDSTPSLEPRHNGIVPAINGTRGNSRLSRIRDILEGQDRPDRPPRTCEAA